MARVAGIDCGTNSIRLLVADVMPDGGLRDVHREMRVVRLGQGVDATGQLAPEAIERTRSALVDYAGVCVRTGVQRVRMVATSATRDAGNREEFFGMVREVLGTDAEVITGDEEARLSFAGAVGELDPAEGPFLVVDLGGGSTELVLGDADGVQAAYSTNIGCVRLTERCLHTDPPTAGEVATAEAVVREVLAEGFAAVPVAKARSWIGVAGTVTTIAAIAHQLPSYDPEAIHLSRTALSRVEQVCGELVGMSKTERLGLATMHPGRADVIGGGAIITRVLAQELVARAGITELVVSEHDILDGIALSLA